MPKCEKPYFTPIKNTFPYKKLPFYTSTLACCHLLSCLYYPSSPGATKFSKSLQSLYRVIWSWYTDLCTLHTLNTMGTWVLSQEENGQRVTMTTHPHLVLRASYTPIHLHSPTVPSGCCRISFKYIRYKGSQSSEAGIPTTLLDDLGLKAW